jgi:hypothetical protein
MTGRDDLEAALRASGSVPVPEPDAAFVAALERRLVAAERSNVVPMVRRARRMGVTAVVTATVVFAGAAAAAGVAITHPFRHDAPVEVSTTSSTSTTGITAPVVVDTAQPATTMSTTSTTSTTASTTSTTTRSTTTSTTSTTTSTTSTTTTEVKVPATITLSCSADGSAVHCSWTGAPAGMARYAVLRSQPGTGAGRVYFVPKGTTTWTDPIASKGTTATYLVHALDAHDASSGHSNAVSVPCC